MKARINRTLLEQTRFDSGALSPANFVVHPYKEEGYYQAEVSRNGQYQYSFGIELTASSKTTQISVDLANRQNGSEDTTKNCDCRNKEDFMQLVPGGYGLFFATNGSGYSVKTFPFDAKKKDANHVFDSTSLQTDDLFGITLLRPGYYVMRDAKPKQKLKSRLQVDPIYPGKKAYAPPEALHLDSGDLKKNRDGVTLKQAQGLVYRSHPNARIIIELEKPIDVDEPKKPARRKKPAGKTKRERRKPVASWTKPGVQR